MPRRAAETKFRTRPCSGRQSSQPLPGGNDVLFFARVFQCRKLTVCRYFLGESLKYLCLDGIDGMLDGWMDSSRLYARWDDSIIYVAESGMEWPGLVTLFDSFWLI